jgi:hypothetical protein
MQLVRALAEVVGTAASDLEALYGLSPARRLPGSSGARAAGRGRASVRPVESLKSQLLRRLLAYPELAREFGDKLVGLLGEVGKAEERDTVDRQIAEVLAVAGAGAPVSCAALLEALAESEFAEQYRALCARDLQLDDDDVEAVRDEMRGGILRMEEARVHSELDALNSELKGPKPLTPQDLERSRVLTRRLSELKHQLGVGGLAKP